MLTEKDRFTSRIRHIKRTAVGNNWHIDCHTDCDCIEGTLGGYFGRRTERMKTKHHRGREGDTDRQEGQNSSQFHKMPLQRSV